jgi:hypothetical protein
MEEIAQKTNPLGGKGITKAFQSLEVAMQGL